MTSTFILVAVSDPVIHPEATHVAAATGHDVIDTIDPREITRLLPRAHAVLVDADTATAYTANVTVLNTPLELRFVPTQYVWDLGDGTQFITTTAGGSYPDGDARGQYTSPGTFTPSVRISWNVSIRMSGGGQWYNVPGDAYTVTVGQPLTAVEAEAVLTANR